MVFSEHGAYGATLENRYTELVLEFDFKEIEYRENF